MSMESVMAKHCFPEQKKLLPAKWQELTSQGFNITIACFHNMHGLHPLRY